VASFERSPADTGSPEVQVARLSARVAQLTAHLQQHRKDYSTRRGLMAVLSQRKQLLTYLMASAGRGGKEGGWVGLRQRLAGWQRPRG
jgi:small subunit ribosomal protein S15